jgi:hypothetical protein
MGTDCVHLVLVLPLYMLVLWSMNTGASMRTAEVLSKVRHSAASRGSCTIPATRIVEANHLYHQDIANVIFPSQSVAYYYRRTPNLR